MPGMPQPGAEWAGFRVEAQIGAGGTRGRAFVVWDRELDRRVVLKALPPDTPDAEKERFLRESRLAGGLDHPVVVPILRGATLAGVPFIVLRHVGGGDLAQRLHLAPLTLESATTIIGQVAAALDRAHRRGLVHRHVEPANILCVEDGGDVYLSGFGTTRSWERDGGVGPDVPHHAAPEQLDGGDVTPAADLYALGCVLFECLTGRVPFPGDTPEAVAARHRDEPPPRLTELRPDLPVELDHLVATAMAKDPGHRYRDARSLAEALALVEPPSNEDVSAATAAAAASTSIVEASVPPDEPPVDEPIDPTRSVFASAEEPPAASPVRSSEPPPDAPPDDGTVDGALYGVYEDDGLPKRTPVVVAALLVVATLAVAALVWRAVNTEAELVADTATTTTTALANDEIEAPTLDALVQLVPDGVEGCVPPEETEGEDGGPVRLRCPNEEAPELLTLELHETPAARDAAFDSVVEQLGVVDRDDAECALGRTGVHRYEAEGHAGTVACHAVSGQVDFVWTRTDAPVLLRLTGSGGYVANHDAWDAMAGRTDARFPVADEQRLLDALPDELLDGCRRDLLLTLSSGGTVAAACEPAEAEPTAVSWVRFGDVDRMNAWFDRQRDGVDGTFDTSDDGCTPQGFGQPDVPIEAPADDPAEEGDAAPTTEPAPPSPTAAVQDYSLDGGLGRVLCFVNGSEQNVVFWVRNGELIGSIAVSDRSKGATMRDLLLWWQRGGHRP